MSAVKDPYLSLFVRLDIIGPDDIYPGFFKRKLILMLSFYYPKVEDFSSVHELIFLTQSLCKGFYLILGISGTDPVNKGVAEIIFSLYPVFKVLRKVPKVSILKYTV